MSGNASSSPWVAGKGRKPGLLREPASRGKVHYFFLQRQSASQVILPASIFTLILIALTYGVHLEEVPKYSNFSERHGHYMLIALAAIPIWYKLPITIPLIAEAVSTAIAWYVFCSDDHPDFSISPRSIWGLDGMSYRRFCWSQIEEIEIRRIKRIGPFTRNKPVTRKLVFYTNVPRNFPIVGNILQLNHIISLWKGISENDKDKIIGLVREFAPDKPMVETSQIIDSHF